MRLSCCVSPVRCDAALRPARLFAAACFSACSSVAESKRSSLVYLRDHPPTPPTPLKSLSLANRGFGCCSLPPLLHRFHRLLEPHYPPAWKWKGERDNVRTGPLPSAS
jgi:hypothetical protein